LVRHRAGLTIIEPGSEAAALSPLPLALLGQLDPAPVNSQQPTPNSQRPTPSRRSTLEVARWELGIGAVFRQWGMRTLGELAALPSDDLAARLGEDGTAWQRLARGEDPHPLLPSLPEE